LSGRDGGSSWAADLKDETIVSAGSILDRYEQYQQSVAAVGNRKLKLTNIKFEQFN
jgi:hypothetical protein